jgi:PhzF family phenazine biosynthesis protein
MPLRVFHVDAFAAAPFEGNPAAVCPLKDWLDDERLLAVASENSLSETAFLVGGKGTYELRWFSPRFEVQLCGHATLASAFIIFTFLEPDLNSVHFETRYRGRLNVSRDGDFLAMDFPALPPQDCSDPPQALLRGLGLQAGSAKVLEANGNYFVIYDSAGAVQRLNPDFRSLEQLHPFGVGITAPGNEPGVDFVSRYFVPSYGIPEDPVTGSTHCTLALYWSEHLGKKTLHARQLSARGGELRCELAGDRVILRGRAVLILQGSLLI